MKMNITSEEIAWVAGILEGEGCFDYQQSNPEKRWPQVRVEMTDKDIILRVQEITGGNVRFVKRYKPHHQDTWLLHIRTAKLVQPLLESIYPFMGQRRQSKIKAMIDNVKMSRRYKTVKKEDVIVIREMYKNGNYTMKELATVFETTRSNINNIVHNRSWLSI